MARVSNADLEQRILHIVEIADAGAPADPALNDRYNAAVRIAGQYRKALKSSCFVKPFKVARLLGPTESFYTIFPDEDPAHK